MPVKARDGAPSLRESFMLPHHKTSDLGDLDGVPGGIRWTTLPGC